MNGSITVEVHQSREELILYLSREMGVEYAEAKAYYEEKAAVVA